MRGRATTGARYAYAPDFNTEPGTILQETIDALGLTQKEFAGRTGYTTKHINQLISGRARVTPEAAVRLERVTRVPAHFWNNLEVKYQERKALKADLDESSRDLGWLEELPVKEMIKRGVLPRTNDKATLLSASLEFFGVASVAAWRKGWGAHQIAFRKAAGAKACSGGIAAWVRIAEVAADKVSCEPYDGKSFQAAIQAVRQLTRLNPAEFVPLMRQQLAGAGVALVLVPEIPGSRVIGAARWLTPTKAMIAVNLLGKSNDRFWFTFFHEAGHLLNDDPNEVYVDVDYADDPREQAANKFAAEILIPNRYAPELPRLKSKAAVRAFAEKLKVHPGIVVGRLRHDEVIPFTHMHDLTVRLDWAES